MKKNILKKIFIKLSKALGYELIDQSDFVSPTLDKSLNEDLSIINKKSIVLPLGEIKITKKVSSLLIIFRTNTDIEIWDQNKKRLFDLRTVLKKLYALGTRNLLVEGGDKMTRNFIKNRFFDEFYLFKSPKKLLIRRNHKVFTSLSILHSKYKKKSKIISKLVKDNVTIYKR